MAKENIGIQNQIVGFLKLNPMKRAEICKKCNLTPNEFRVNINALKKSGRVKVRYNQHYYPA